MTHDVTRFGRHWWGSLLLAAVMCGCGESSSRVSGGILPDGATDPHAYTEEFLARNPGAALRLTHLAVMDLRADDTTDVVPYYVDRPLTLTAAIDESADQVDALVVRTARGRELGRVRRRAGAIRLATGWYTLEIVRARSAALPAQRQTVFVRPQALAGGVTLTASANCVNCSFNLTDLDNQDFDGTNLSGSTFIGASISDSTFRGATMNGCDLSGSPYGQNTNIIFTDFSGAHLNGAHFDYVQLGSETTFGGPSPTPAADLTNATFGGVLSDDFQYLVGLIEGADFSNCAMTGARFTGVQILLATFQGADLSGADFTASGTVVTGTPMQTVCASCDFSVEPSTGNSTNLSGAILAKAGAQPFELASGTSFAGANLSGAQMANADFGGLLFTGADLDHATLAGAQFAGASFADATLRNADLTGALIQGLDLRGADFTSATLDNATLDNSMVDGVIVSGASFSHASMNGLNLYAFDMHGLNLNSASLLGTNLDYADLKGANLAGADLGSPMGSSDTPASLIGAYMPDVNLSNADLRRVDLTGAHLYGDAATTLLDGALFDGATLVGAICSGAKFDAASLSGAVLDNAQLVNCTFAQADLSGASLDSTYLQGADFSGAASVINLRLSNAAISTAPGVWTFTEQNGMPFNFQFGATVLGGAASDPSVVCPNGENGPCVGAKLQPVLNGPHPPVPTCVPGPPDYDNCSAPSPPATPTPAPAP